MRKVSLLFLALCSLSTFTQAQPAPACGAAVNYGRTMLARLGTQTGPANNALRRLLFGQNHRTAGAFIQGNQHPVTFLAAPPNHPAYFQQDLIVHNQPNPLQIIPHGQAPIQPNLFARLWQLLYPTPTPLNDAPIIDTPTILHREAPLQHTLRTEEDDSDGHVSFGTRFPPIRTNGGYYLQTGGGPDDDGDGTITFVPSDEPPFIYNNNQGNFPEDDFEGTPIFAPALARFFRYLAHAFGHHGDAVPIQVLRALHDCPEEIEQILFADITHGDNAEEIAAEWARLQDEPHGMDPLTLAENLFDNLTQAFFYPLTGSARGHRDTLQHLIEAARSSLESARNHLPDPLLLGHLVLEATLLVQAGIDIDDMLFPLYSDFSGEETIAMESLNTQLDRDLEEDPASESEIDLAMEIALGTLLQFRLHLLRQHIEPRHPQSFRAALRAIQANGITETNAVTAASIVRQNGGATLPIQAQANHAARLFAEARWQFVRACLLAWQGHDGPLSPNPYTVAAYNAASGHMHLYCLHHKLHNPSKRGGHSE